MEFSPELMVRIEKEIGNLVGKGVLGEKTEQLVVLRFGIGRDRPLTVSEMAKVLRKPVRVVRESVESAERKVFNLLKDRV
jgi:hypothetical protein